MGPRLPLIRLVAALALTAPAVALTVAAVAPGEAHAQAFPQPLVELIPGGEVVGDGQTQVELHFVALGVDGKPLAGLNGKFGGGVKDAKLTEVQPGLYRATWTPPAVDKRKALEFTFSGTSAGGKIERAWSITVQPPAPTKVGASASPDKLTLGVDSTASVTFRLDGPSGPVATGELVALASNGSVQNITNMGDGRYIAQFTAPTPTYPQLALVTVADRRDPARSYGQLVIPLNGKTTFKVPGQPPGATVILNIAGQEFMGQADGTGTAPVNIVVPPGVTSAKVTTVLNGQRTESQVDLKPPPSKRVLFFPASTGVPADPSQGVPLRAFVTRPDGQPDTAARVTFSADKGSVSEAKHEGNGIYAATFSPPTAAAAGTVTFKVSVADSAGAQEDSVAANLAPTRPGGLRLNVEPPSLDPTTTTFQVLAKVTDPAGAGSAGRSLSFTAAGAAAEGATQDLGNGDYKATFRTVGNTNVELVGSASVPASGNPLARVLVLPLRDAIKTGDDYTSVAIITIDQYGYPVANVPVELSAITGDGRLSGNVTTDGGGVAIATYTAGKDAAIVTIRAEAQGRVGSGALVQSAATLSLPPLTPSSSPLVGTQIAAWKRTLATAAAPAVELLPMNGGTISAPVSVGNGEFTANYTVPAGATGDLRVAVSTSGGAVASILTLPVSGAAAGAWGAAPAGPAQAAQPAQTQPAQPAQPEPAKEPKAPKTPGEFTWLRASAGYSGGIYSYFERSTLTDGPIYDGEVNVGYGDVDTAKTAGFDIHGRAWLPMLDYVGFDAGYRLTRWSIQMPEGFEDPIKDGISRAWGKAMGRYHYDSGKNRFSAGGSIGFQTSDFMYFRVDRSDDPEVNDVLNYDQLVTVGPTLGFEASYELGKQAYAQAGYEMGFTDFNGIFSDAISLELGYALNDFLYVTGNAGRFHRSTRIYYGDNKDYVGDLEDQLWSFGLGLGYQR